VNPNVSRSVPVTLSSPTAASAKPIIMEAMVLAALPAAHADERRKRSADIREKFRRAEAQGEPATTGERKVIMMTADQRSEKRGGEGRRQRAPRTPVLRQGWPSNVSRPTRARREC